MAKVSKMAEADGHFRRDAMPGMAELSRISMTPRCTPTNTSHFLTRPGHWRWRTIARDDLRLPHAPTISAAHDALFSSPARHDFKRHIAPAPMSLPASAFFDFWSSCLFPNGRHISSFTVPRRRQMPIFTTLHDGRAPYAGHRHAVMNDAEC